MPELPEVETTRRGIEPYVLHQTIKETIVRNARLRWPIADHLGDTLHKQKIHAIARRGKYLLLHCDRGCLIIHLGMSGKLTVLQKPCHANKHDHFELIFVNKTILRFTDPRRFGAIIWTDQNPLDHPLLKHLGPEPLLPDFQKNYLYAQTRNRNVSIKQLVMDGKVVVGVGNIYANEALFLAKLLPTRAAKTLSLSECSELVKAIKKILKQAIQSGGSTLKDFLQADGKPGYFTQKLLIYDRADLACLACKKIIQVMRLGQRATYYCAHCQK